MYLFFIFFFFLMIRRPPRSTLFPTRRSSDLPALAAGRGPFDGSRPAAQERGLDGRSEEHTSELQSQFHIVCRLLLENKNKSVALQPAGLNKKHRITGEPHDTDH